MPRPTTLNVWRHMRTFADASLDKIVAWRGEIAPGSVEFKGAEEFARLARERSVPLKKVQAAIQADQVRVSSPSRDELQTAIRMLKGHDFGIELKFGNYRE
jgi:uncharacterized protein YajQ (UPF0234 family)